MEEKQYFSILVILNICEDYTAELKGECNIFSSKLSNQEEKKTHTPCYFSLQWVGGMRVKDVSRVRKSQIITNCPGMALRNQSMGYKEYKSLGSDLGCIHN